MLQFDFHRIGNKLLEVRKRRGLTQAEVAEAAGISDRTYAEIERGTINTRVETILKICKVLCITPDVLLVTENTAKQEQEAQLLQRLNSCTTKERETAMRLLSVYLDSLD